MLAILAGTNPTACPRAHTKALLGMNLITTTENISTESLNHSRFWKESLDDIYGAS